jgi:hypothetical protein
VTIEDILAHPRLPEARKLYLDRFFLQVYGGDPFLVRLLIESGRFVVHLIVLILEAGPEDMVARSFAIIREAGTRTLGQRHYDVQLIGGYALVRGMVAEMATGEGKTLAATLAAATAALAAVPVHVVTVNSYLAARDAEQMATLYRFLGLTVGVVTEDIPPAQRAAAYRCDITYCTNKDLAFDYTRNRLRLGRRLGNLRRKVAGLAAAPDRADGALLRGLHFAIIDEADSVLIDEARTPLILSGETDEDRDLAVFDQALAQARRLRLDVHYRLVREERRLELLEEGRRHIVELKRLGPPWDQRSERERLIAMALTALHVLQADEHYLVRDGKVEIIDEFTGRIMPDRSWVEGLHEMIERKEGLALSARRGTKSRMTYQRFFRRYCRLAGMTGTAQEVTAELWRVYRLRTAAVPPHRPDRKAALPSRAHAGVDAKWRAIAAEVATIHKAGAPVLIGTRTVAATKIASDALAARGTERCRRRRRGRDRGACRRARRDHHRHQHGGPRHRYPARRGSGRARRPARGGQRAARGRPDRPPARRPVWTARRPRPHPFACFPRRRSGGSARLAIPDRNGEAARRHRGRVMDEQTRRCAARARRAGAGRAAACQNAGRPSQIR